MICYLDQVHKQVKIRDKSSENLFWKVKITFQDDHSEIGCASKTYSKIGISAPKTYSKIGISAPKTYFELTIPKGKKYLSEWRFLLKEIFLSTQIKWELQDTKLGGAYPNVFLLDQKSMAMLSST